ncbi:MAG: hypothetical protein KGJ35_00820 [Patescibacteria group bacterium]|nr:hypothetical protein [Patescibacteria group bacterium]
MHIETEVKLNEHYKSVVTDLASGIQRWCVTGHVPEHLIDISIVLTDDLNFARIASNDPNNDIIIVLSKDLNAKWVEIDKPSRFTTFFSRPSNLSEATFQALLDLEKVYSH